MAFDAHQNLAVSSVALAPAPPGTGLSLNVAAGEGARFPAPPFNATVWPGGASPTPANAEILRVTARTGDNLTIARMQEGTAARAIVVGDLIAATITAKTLTDVETQAALLAAANTFAATQTLAVDLVVGRDLYEKARATPIGHWITVAPGSVTWTASGAGSVAVNSTNGLAYTLIGKTCIYTFYAQITVTGTPSVIALSLPAGMTSAVLSGGTFLRAGAPGMILVSPGGLTLGLYADAAGATTWTAGAYAVIGTLAFPIQ
jgi:hypothetical protein